MAAAPAISAQRFLLLQVLLAAAPWAARAESMREVTDRLLVGYSKDTNPTLAAAFAELGPDQCPAAPPASNLVETQIYVQKLANIDQKSGTYELEGFLRHWWNDPRLKFDGIEQGGCVDKLVLLDGPNRIWIPDYYIPPSVAHSIGAKNDGQMMDIYPSGDIFWSQRLRVTLNCAMNFERMPWDEQSCSIALGPYSFPGTEVEYRWKAGRPAMDKLEDQEDAEWTIGTQSFRDHKAVFGIGSWWSEVHVDFTLTRRPDTYVSLNNRVVLLVCLAYFGCWVAPAQALTLAVIAVLVVTGVLAQVDSRLPPLSYSVWLIDFQGGCLTFTCILFMLYAVLNFGIQQDDKLTDANKEVTDAAVARVKMITNALQLVKSPGARANWVAEEETRTPSLTVEPDIPEIPLLSDSGHGDHAANPRSGGGVAGVLERAFAEHDQDGSGMLDEAEFEILMAKLDILTRPGDFARIDDNSSGSIEMGEFVAYFESRDTTTLPHPSRFLKATACLKYVDVWTRLAFPVVFAVYIIAMHLAWSGYGEERDATA